MILEKYMELNDKLIDVNQELAAIFNEFDKTTVHTSEEEYKRIHKEIGAVRKRLQVVSKPLEKMNKPRNPSLEKMYSLQELEQNLKRHEEALIHVREDLSQDLTIDEVYDTANNMLSIESGIQFIKEIRAYLRRRRK